MTRLLSVRWAVSLCLTLGQSMPSSDTAARRGQASSRQLSPCPSSQETAAQQTRLPSPPALLREGQERASSALSTTHSCSLPGPALGAGVSSGALGRLSQGSCPSVLPGRDAFRPRQGAEHPMVPRCCRPASGMSSRGGSPCRHVPGCAGS